jgi:hypothetical protein
MARRSASANLWRETKALLENVEVSVRDDLNHISEHKIGYETQLMSAFGSNKMRTSVNLGGQNAYTSLNETERGNEPRKN